MSETLTIDTSIEAPEVRRYRRDVPDRSMTGVIDPVTIEDDGDSFSPEQAAAAAARELQASEARAAAATQAATEARAREQHAIAEATRANAGRHIDRTAAVAGSVEAARAEADRAESAYIAAAEIGDTPAQAKALREMTAAETRLTNASGELDLLKARGAASAPPPSGQTQNQPGPAAREWIGRHPQFDSDPAYRMLAVRAHEEALRDGIMAETPAYFRHIDGRIAEQYGDGDHHHQEQRQEKRSMPPQRGQFQGAAPSRGDGRGSSSSSTVQTLIGPLTVTRRADGKIGIQIPPELRDTFEEGAKITGMSLADYAHEQVKIADERRAGGSGSLIERETQSYR